MKIMIMITVIISAFIGICNTNTITKTTITWNDNNQKSSIVIFGKCKDIKVTVGTNSIPYKVTETLITNHVHRVRK